MKATENQEKLVSWAVETLGNEPCKELPDGFLTRFEARLAQEPSPDVLVEFSPVERPRQRSAWTRMLMAALVMLAILGTFWVIKPKCLEDSSSLVVLSVSNQVEIASVLVSQVTELKKAQTLVTKADSEVVLMVGAIGNTIRVGPQSEVRLNETSLSDGATLAELNLERGSLYVQETEAKISVRTRHAHIRPIGTQYKVSEDSRGTSVSVSEGSVLITPVGGSLVRLNAGEQIRLDSKNDQKKLRPVLMKAERLKRLKNEFRTNKPDLLKAPSLGSPLSPYPKSVAPKRTLRTNPKPGFRRPSLGGQSTFPRAANRPARQRTSAGTQLRKVRQARRQAVGKQSSKPQLSTVRRPNQQTSKTYPRARVRARIQSIRKQRNSQPGSTLPRLGSGQRGARSNPQTRASRQYPRRNPVMAPNSRNQRRVGVNRRSPAQRRIRNRP